MKFSEMPYARPDTETVKKQLTKLTERLKNAGTYEEARAAFLEEQKASLFYLLQQLREQFSDAMICGHRDFSPDLNGNGIIEPWEWMKACPCFDAIDEYQNL